jgi:uncharacterized protein (DUF362 family)
MQCSAVGAAAMLIPPTESSSALVNSRPAPTVAIVKNGNPSQLIDKVVELLGGIRRFVSPGQSVLIKPNIGWDRLPEQAATTNPEAVAQMVRLCKEAGAGRVRVLDRTCNQAIRCYRQSGIEAAVQSAGAEVRFVIDSRFKQAPIANGRVLKEWPICQDALECDVLINMPIAKTHSISGVTLGMKNVMGLIGGNRGLIHTQFVEKIVDLNMVIRPCLTIIDGYRVLIRNGPTGGSLDDVEEKRTVIASADVVAADANGAWLLGIDPTTIQHLQHAHERDLGEIDRGKMIIMEYDFAL